MVLWLTAALSAIGLAVANNVRGETERTETNVDDARSYFIARGAIRAGRAACTLGLGSIATRTAARFTTFPATLRWISLPLRRSSRGYHPGDFEAESERLTPGRPAASPLALGVPEDQADGNHRGDRRLAHACPDPTQPSPFDAFYLSQSPSFLPRHASFLENEELLLVKGMTADLYYGSSLDRSHAGLRDCLSVYGSVGSGGYQYGATGDAARRSGWRRTMPQRSCRAGRTSDSRLPRTSRQSRNRWDRRDRACGSAGRPCSLCARRRA